MKGKLEKTGIYMVATLSIVAVSLLIVFGLPITGWKALSVQTGSMRPHIPPGSLVLVHRVPGSQLRIGDVITYNSMVSPGEQITHRIVGFKQVGPVREVVVKGDANPLPDPPLLASQVVGKVAGSAPYIGRVIDFVHSPLGLALLVYVPALAVIFYEIKHLVDGLTELEMDKRTKAARASARLYSPKIRRPSASETTEVKAAQNPSRLLPGNTVDPGVRGHTQRPALRSIDGIRV